VASEKLKNRKSSRKVSRVFLKPSSPQRDMEKFLNSLRNENATPAGLDGVALVTQLLLLDSHGNPQPTRFTVEFQARLFDRGHDGKTRSSLKVDEISRKLLSENPSSGGLVTEEEGAPAYLSDGGSYGFAEGQMVGRDLHWSEPVQVKLRTRCERCHADDLALVRTLAISSPPHAKLPPVRQLDPAGIEAADFDISAKRRQQDFQSLLGYFR
jgi:hypothetical protein